MQIVYFYLYIHIETDYEKVRFFNLYLKLERGWLEASNQTGFSAHPYNARADDGTFFPSGSNLWTGTENNTQEAWYTIVYNNSASRYFRNKKTGLPVRCLKD